MSTLIPTHPNSGTSSETATVNDTPQDDDAAASLAAAVDLVTDEDEDELDSDWVEPTPEERAQWERENTFIEQERSGPEQHPRLFNLSVGLMYQAVMRAEVPDRPEYVTITPLDEEHKLSNAADFVALWKWNAMWESAQFRRRYFDEDELTPEMARIADLGDRNIVFVPRTQARYQEYAPIYHLLPRRTLERFNLPLLHAGIWPYSPGSGISERLLPDDFHTRLGRAWAHTVWKQLMPASGIRSFAKDEPVRLLAHNLDYWLPPVTEVIEDILRGFPIVGDFEPAPIHLIDSSVLEGAVTGGPRKGGDIWRGEDEAADLVEEVIEVADEHGQLRGILDAVRSHRVADDFSAHWSFAKEDFERKLYSKRSKIKVTFVELTDTIPVQGPETEVVGNLVTADFLTLLKPKDREIVVLLNSGMTSLTNVAAELGYASHSAVSKRLAQIQKQARTFFDALD